MYYRAAVLGLFSKFPVWSEHFRVVREYRPGSFTREIAMLAQELSVFQLSGVEIIDNDRRVYVISGWLTEF